MGWVGTSRAVRSLWTSKGEEASSEAGSVRLARVFVEKLSGGLLSDSRSLRESFER